MGLSTFSEQAGVIQRERVFSRASLLQRGSGNPWLPAALIEAAHGPARSKGTFLGELFCRLSKRLGVKKALAAVAHRILESVYHLLQELQSYQELGDRFVQERERIKQQAIRRLERLGYQVNLPTQGAA